MLTRRKQIIDMLKEHPMTAKQIAEFFLVELKEIVEDLSHIAKSIYPNLKMYPAYCKKCGFEFKERTKVKTPSKCPKCKAESIQAALFKIE